jgi:hypothetical protein
MAAVFRRHWLAAGRSAKMQRLLLRMRHSSAAVRTWSRRFRFRWNISWRRLCTRAEMSSDSIRFWVSFFDQNGDLNRDRKGAPNLGTIFGSTNGDPLVYRVRHSLMKRGPKLCIFGVPKLSSNASPFSGARVRRVGSVVAALVGC